LAKLCVKTEFFPDFGYLQQIRRISQRGRNLFGVYISQVNYVDCVDNLVPVCRKLTPF